MSSDVSIDPATRLKKLNQKASDFICDDKIPVVRYLRSTKEMERMALVYAEEHEYENGFLLYMKMIVLLVEKLPKHPQFKGVSDDERRAMRKRCNNALQAAEKLKSLLKAEFQKEYDHWLLQEQERKKREEDELKREEELKKQEEIKRQQELERQEEQKRNNVFKDVPSPSPAAVIATAQGIGESGSDVGPASLDPLAKVESYSSIPTASDIKSQPSAPPPDDSISSSPMHHTTEQPPAYTAQQPPQYQSQQPPSYSSLQNPEMSPEKTFFQPPTYQDVSNHNISNTYPVNDVPTFDRSAKPRLFTTPEVNRSTKPADVFRQDSSLDGKVIISHDLIPRFLEVASKNTSRNLETCGILTGKLSRNTFRITHLVIPKQSATPDSCTTESEEELFDVQDKHDLITLGWIHTHPSQTSFLSSVDLHTQCSYQQLMPEAIAIVCSPKYQTIGMYQLTRYGVQFISSCTQPGFHPHPKEPPLYEESSLVSVDNTMKIELIDLR